jgi:hypothetical protein
LRANFRSKKKKSSENAIVHTKKVQGAKRRYVYHSDAVCGNWVGKTTREMHFTIKNYIKLWRERAQKKQQHVRGDESILTHHPPQPVNSSSSIFRKWDKTLSLLPQLSPAHFCHLIASNSPVFALTEHLFFQLWKLCVCLFVPVSMLFVCVRVCCKFVIPNVYLDIMHVHINHRQ